MTNIQFIVLLVLVGANFVCNALSLVRDDKDEDG